MQLHSLSISPPRVATIMNGSAIYHLLTESMYLLPSSTIALNLLLLGGSDDQYIVLPSGRTCNYIVSAVPFQYIAHAQLSVSQSFIQFSQRLILSTRPNHRNAPPPLLF
jgi:hypothetical protein